MAKRPQPITLGDYVPPVLFGKDHWSTLAYAETVMVDLGGFQVGLDAHMRQGRRNFRVMSELCRKPKRIKNNSRMAVVMELKYSTRLADGSVVEGHDDWHCIQDLAQAGYFDVAGELATAENIEPGVILHLSPLGRQVANLLRTHKAAGGMFGDFKVAGGYVFAKTTAAVGDRDHAAAGTERA